MAKNKNTQSLNLFKQEIPKMPEGYYSGDKPNPNLRAFVEQHIKERPYDPETDDYDVPVFDKPIETTKATAIYNMHAYWSKKPHDAIRQYIRHYTKSGDLVLDPFCGSGGTALAALMEGRRAIAIDRSPAATFITKNYCTPVDVDEYKSAIEKIWGLVANYYESLYATICPNCGCKASIGYTVYSQTVECLKCVSIVPLFPKGNSKNRTCFKCETLFSGREDKYLEVPVRRTLKCINGCKKKSEIFDPTTNDSKLLKGLSLPDWYDDSLDKRLGVEFPKGLITRQPIASGAVHVEDIYTPRNLIAAKLLHSAINNITCSNQVRYLLQFTFNGICLNISKMLRETKRAIQSGTYYLPPLYREINVWNAFSYKAGQIIKGILELNNSLAKDISIAISTSSAVDLHNIPANSVDYIFTDPPYGAKVQFAEANFIWEIWQGFDVGWWSEEIIINEPRSKDEDQWFDMMFQSFSEAFRILKPGRVISVCFHGDTSIWSKLQDTFSFVGFLAERTEYAIYIDAKEKSYKQRTADNVQLRDLVINFRKPKPGESMSIIAFTGDEGETTFNEKVCQTIYEYLERYPGSTKDRIYDEVVSRMVKSIRMEAHNFDELLGQVAEEIKTPVKKDLFRNEEPNIFGAHEVSRWYLKDTELAVSDSAETAREDAAAKNLAVFMEKNLKDHPDKEGVHYSDLFEHYIYVAKDKPRRHLAEFLPDYFYKTEVGTWRLPASEEEKRAKAEARAKGLGRRVKRYISWIEQGVAIPESERPSDATLTEWIRHCKRAGLYEHGKLLYEKGGLNPDNLPEEAMVDVEEDYQVCARMLKR